MRLVKAALFGLMMCSLWWMWTSRDAVVSAYTDPQESSEVRLRGVDLAIERTDMGPSPFHVPAAPDTRRKPLAVLFTTSTTIEPPVVEMGEGASTIAGTAMGSDGPAHGGIVRIERHTADGLGTIDARVGPDGRWRAEGLPGGRYRVRAWVPGRSTTAGSEVFFLEAEASLEIDFVLYSVDPQPRIQFIDGAPTFIGQTGTVAVEVTQEVVDAEGLIATVPVVGAPISMVATAEVSAPGGQSNVTGGDGVAWFALRCELAGRPHMVVRYGAVSAGHDLPECRPVPPPPPEPEPEPEPLADPEPGSVAEGSTDG